MKPYHHIQVDDQQEAEGCWDRYCIPTRYVLAIWASVGFFIVYALRVNLSVAIVEMVNSTYVAQHGSNGSDTVSVECPDLWKNTTDIQNSTGEFNWDEKTQGYILGAFFWGYIPLQTPAGYFADRIGGKWLFGVGVLWTSVLTLFTPIAARAGYMWLIVLRVLEGAGESITYPAMNAMLGHWVPPMESSFISAIVYAGSFLGLVAGLLVSGVLIKENVMGGWPSVFYIMGIVGCFWFICWGIFAFSTPKHHPRISNKERDFIESSIGLRRNMDKAPRVPWKSILTSMPVWAISVCNFCAMWSLYTLLTCLPQYFKYILNYPIDENGYMSSIPYLISGITFIVFCKSADIIRGKNILSTHVTRKVFNTAGMACTSIFLVAVAYVGCDRTLAVVFLCLGAGLGNLYTAGFMVNHIDLAPQYAGILFGLTNSIATFSGVFGPLVVGALTNNQQTREQWAIVFYTSSAISVFGGVFYLIFSSGNRQPWATKEEEYEVLSDSRPS